MTLDPLRMLGANLRVASNLTYHDQKSAIESLRVIYFQLLQVRAGALDLELSPCYLDPNCDGDCGCGPGLRKLAEQPGKGDLIIEGDIDLIESHIASLEIAKVRIGCLLANLRNAFILKAGR